ncbi:hypothetical protein DYB32_009888, partial [Aphanomyces invadans]
VPRIAFVNKLDREGASFDRTLGMIESRYGHSALNFQDLTAIVLRFNVTVLPVQLPMGENADFHGVVDLVTMEMLTWSDPEGQVIRRYDHVESADLSRLDNCGMLDRLPLVPGASNEAMQQLYTKALKARQSLIEKASDFDETLADLFLCEEPIDATMLQAALRRITVAKPDDHPNAVVALCGRNVKERLTRLMLVAADDADEVDEIKAGNIGAAVGLKNTYTGDTLVAGNAVFTCSIESDSLSRQKELDEALGHLQREDPSFVVMQDEETGQTLMSGMGELHLEILQDRLKTEYKLDPSIGKMRVAYRETIASPFEVGLCPSMRTGRSLIEAHVPLAHMVGYATSLRSKTQGEADFSMQFLKYSPVV